MHLSMCIARPNRVNTFGNRKPMLWGKVLSCDHGPDFDDFPVTAWETKFLMKNEQSLSGV